MEYISPKWNKKISIHRAEYKDIDNIMEIYNLLSLKNEYEEKIDLNWNKCYSKTWWIVKTPDKNRIKEAIKNENHIFNIAECNNEMTWFLWWCKNFSKLESFYDFFSKEWILHKDYYYFQKDFDINSVAYWADLMIKPEFQKNVFSWLLYYNFLKELSFNWKKTLLFMIEDIISTTKHWIAHIMNIPNTASLNMQLHFDPMHIKTINDNVEIYKDIYIERKCEYYTVNIENTLKKMEEFFKKIKYI